MKGPGSLTPGDDLSEVSLVTRPLYQILDLLRTHRPDLMRPVTLALGDLSKDNLSPLSVKHLPEVLEPNVKEGQVGAEELPGVGARDLVVGFPPYSTAPVVTTNAQCFTPRAANWMKNGDGDTPGDNCRLESIGISKTIIESNISGMNITFVVPFISSMSSRPSTTWTRGPTKIKSSG